VTVRSFEALQAISLEISRAPKVALLEDPAEVPTIPEGQAVVLIDLELPDFSVLPGRPVGRFMEAVAALIRHESVPWLIEVHEPEDFARAYRSVLDGIKSNQASPLLLYAPHHGSGRHFQLSYEVLSRTRSMLELLGYRTPDETQRETNSCDTTLPSDTTPLELARRRRAQLLEEEHWLDAGKVHQQQQGGDPSAPGANNTSSRLRRRGELLGAWDGREYMHAAFQFDHKTGRLMPEMKELLEILPKDRGGWRQTFWLFQPHALLDGKRPADVFCEDPALVIEAARSTFTPGNTNW
jgi:hypothetical protein